MNAFIDEAKQYTRFDLIQIEHQQRGSFIMETCHYVAPFEPLPFYVSEKSLPHLRFRPLTRQERRHIHTIKKEYAKEHATALTSVLEQFNEREILEEVAEGLANGRRVKA